MYIGLYDEDLQRGIIQFPSLELMKVASTFAKSDVVEYISNLQNISKYDLVFYKKDSVQRDMSLINLTDPQKIVLLGKGFTGKFIPLEDKFDQGSLNKNYYQLFFRTHPEVFSTRKKTTWNKIVNNNDFICLRVTHGDKKLKDFDKKIPTGANILLYDIDFLLSPFAKDFINKSNLNKNKIFLLYTSSCINFDLFKYAIKSGIKSYDRNQVGITYSGEISKEMFITNKDIFSRNFTLSTPFKFWNNEYDLENLISKLSDYANFIMLSLAYGKYTRITQHAVRNKTLESSVFDAYCRYSGIISKSSKVNFLTFMENSSKINKERIKLFLKKYPYFKAIFSVVPREIFNRGTWRFL